MTALKAHEVGKFLSHPTLKRGLFLIYGPDRGLVHESAQKLMVYFAGDDNDPMAEVTLDAGELSSDPTRLAVEARTISMFGGLRRIRVRGATKALVPTLKEILADLPDAVIVLEAANLPPRDGLRALAEADKQARALPCYGDTGETLSALIRQTFNEAGISADPEAVSILANTLGNDREITRRELEKLTLYAMQTKRLDARDIALLCGDNAAEAIDDILDSAGTGRTEKLDLAVSRAFNAGIDAQRLLISALMHFTWLRRLRVDVDAGKSARDVLDGQRPRPHFSRKANLEQQLRLWRDEPLAAATSRIYEAIAESRKTAPLAAVIAHRALLAISIAAAHR